MISKDQVAGLQRFASSFWHTSTDKLQDRHSRSTAQQMSKADYEVARETYENWKRAQ